MRLLLTPCCAEHALKKTTAWPGWDDYLVWPEEGSEPLYRYFTQLDGALYELNPIEAAPRFRIYRLPETGVGERTLIAEFAPEHDDPMTALAIARADLPFLLSEISS